MIVRVDSLSHPGLQPYARLTEAQLRNRLEPEQGIFIAESPKVIEAALEAGCVPLSLLTEEKHLPTMAHTLATRMAKVPVYVGERKLLQQLTGYELSRGVLCAMRRPVLPSPQEVCSGKHRVVVLDNVVNSTNTGAILRAAAALGIEGALFSPTCCDPLNRRSVRVSMGTVFKIPWTYMPTWPKPGVEQLREWGFRTVAMALRPDAIPLDSPQLDLGERLAIVLGTEGDGLSQDTIDRCDCCVTIPMALGVDSLNVAAAAAVAFWQLRPHPGA